MRLIFVQRRLQPYWLLASGLTLAASLGVAYGSATSLWVGWVTAIICCTLVAWYWLSSAADITLDETGLRVGRAFLDASVIGECQVLTAAEFIDRTSRNSRADDFNSLLQRNAGGVVVRVNDPEDPHKNWVIGTRRAGELSQALTKLRNP